MDRYDFAIARAKEIVDRYRLEEVEDNDIQSDSKLSMPASSLFDGVDIEGVELGDIEMGGIAGSGLADQDDQGDSIDGQDNGVDG